MDGFLFEGNLEAAEDFGLDGVAEAGDVSVCGVTSVDEGEGVFGGDAGVAQGEAFVEASLVEEPRGG